MIKNTRRTLIIHALIVISLSLVTLACAWLFQSKPGHDQVIALGHGSFLVSLLMLVCYSWLVRSHIVVDDLQSAVLIEGVPVILFLGSTAVGIVCAGLIWRSSHDPWALLQGVVAIFLVMFCVLSNAVSETLPRSALLGYGAVILLLAVRWLLFDVTKRFST